MSGWRILALLARDWSSKVAQCSQSATKSPKRRCGMSQLGSGRIVGNPETIANDVSARGQSPSMRRPVPSKCFSSLARTFPSFFSSAKPPLSPPFHPHSCVSDFRSVPVGCSRFSRCCYLISALSLPLLEGSFGPGLCRSHLNSAVELGCSTNSLGHCANFLLAIVQRFVDLSTHPQPMQQYRQLARHRNHRSFLGVLPSSRGELLSPAPQITIFPKGSQNVVRPLYQQCP